MATKIKLIADNVITTSQIDTSSLDSHFTGGTGVTYSSGTISIGQAVHSTDSPTFADLTLTGNLNITGDINSYNVTDLDVTDQTITLGAGQTEALSGGSGIIIDGSGASILWDETNDTFDFNKGIDVTGNIQTNGIYRAYDSVSTNYRNVLGYDSGNVKLQTGTGSSSYGISLFTAGTERLTINGSGNVGIGTGGTATPQRLTSALSDSSTAISSGNLNLELTNTNGSNNTYSRIIFNDTVGGAGSGIFGVKLTDTTNNYGQFEFWNRGSSGFGTRMVIDPNGNVGIGTDSPSSKLTILNNTQDGTTNIRQYATFGPSNSWLDSDTVGWAGAGLGEVQIHNGTANRPPILSLGGNLAAGELLGAVNFFRSSNTDTYRQRAYIASGLTSSGTADQYGADLRFATADNGATSPGLRMQINGSQTEVSFLRANNWHNSSLNTVGGPALEIGYSGSLAYVHGYNRNASQYVEVAYDGSAHRWYTSGGTPNMFLTANGQLLCNFQTPASTSNYILGVDGGIGLGGDDLIASGAGYGPSNSSAGAGTIKLYDTGTGNMNFNQTYTHARYYFYHGGNEVFRIEDGGFSGIYGYSFHYTTQHGSVGVGALNSGYHHTMTQSGPSTFYWNNPCQASGGFSTYSDERLKENITTITGALDKVALMNGVTFNWIDAENRGGGNAGKQFGVTAQNMLEVDPELPTLLSDPLETQENIDNEELETDYYTMDYSRITPFLIEAVKELKTKLEAAEARITELEG